MFTVLDGTNSINEWKENWVAKTNKVLFSV